MATTILTQGGNLDTANVFYPADKKRNTERNHTLGKKTDAPNERLPVLFHSLFQYRIHLKTELKTFPSEIVCYFVAC